MRAGGASARPDPECVSSTGRAGPNGPELGQPARVAPRPGPRHRLGPHDRHRRGRRKLHRRLSRSRHRDLPRPRRGGGRRHRGRAPGHRRTLPVPSAPDQPSEHARAPHGRARRHRRGHVRRRPAVQPTRLHAGKASQRLHAAVLRRARARGRGHGRSIDAVRRLVRTLGARLLARVDGRSRGQASRRGPREHAVALARGASAMPRGACRDLSPRRDRSWRRRSLAGVGVQALASPERRGGGHRPLHPRRDRAGGGRGRRTSQARRGRDPPSGRQGAGLAACRNASSRCWPR